MPTPVPIVIPALFGGGVSEHRAIKKITKEKLGYTPDFTARVLGAVAQLTPAEYELLPTKIQTGLEIRPIVTVGTITPITRVAKISRRLTEIKVPKVKPISKKRTKRGTELNRRIKDLLII